MNVRRRNIAGRLARELAEEKGHHQMTRGLMEARGRGLDEASARIQMHMRANAKLESENARLKAGLERIGMLSASYKPVVERLLNGETIEQIAALPADLPIEIMRSSAQLTRELLTSVAFEHRDSNKFAVALAELQAFLRMGPVM